MQAQLQAIQERIGEGQREVKRNPRPSIGSNIEVAKLQIFNREAR